MFASFRFLKDETLMQHWILPVKDYILQIQKRVYGFLVKLTFFVLIIFMQMISKFDQ